MPFRNNPHGAPGKDHGCDRSEVLMSYPTAWTEHHYPTTLSTLVWDGGVSGCGMGAVRSKCRP